MRAARMQGKNKTFSTAGHGDEGGNKGGCGKPNNRERTEDRRGVGDCFDHRCILCVSVCYNSIVE